MSKKHLDPSQVVLDLVLAYSPWMPQLWQAAVFPNATGASLVMAALNNRDQFVTLSTQVYFGGQPDELAPRFVLFKLGPTVWKLSPSVNHPLLHGYVTLVGVPETATWS